MTSPQSRTTAGSEREKTAPVQGWPAGIPWSLHLEAYAAYCKKWRPQAALIEGGCRGGFSVGELDEFIPGWREKVSEIGRLRAEIEILQTELDRLRASQPSGAAGGEVAPSGKLHSLKTDPDVFDAVWKGLKTFEIRFNDRDFRAGDWLSLHETRHSGADMKAGAPLDYTGRTMSRQVSHVLSSYGLTDGWVCLSLASLASPSSGGWQWVPVEPTEEMHAAAVRTIVRCTGNDDFPPRVYRAMLAAAPKSGDKNHE